MKISRQVGTTNEILNVFVSDASVTTGAGLANVSGSSVAYAWFRSDATGASTGTASTAGSMGVYSTSAWVQVDSTNAKGWYQFGVPNGIFASGRSGALYMNGAPNMAPLPIEIELTKTDNQTYMSSQAIGNVLAQVSSNVYRVYSQNAVTSAAGEFRVSTQALATTSNANILQVYGSAIVTSASGQLLVSTQALPTTTRANVIECYGTAIVTSAGGQLRVSTQTIDKSGYDLSAAGIAAILNTTMAEGYRASSDAGSLMQLQYEILANLIDFTHSGTTRALNSITSHAVSGLEYQYDSSSSPASITRIA